MAFTIAGGTYNNKEYSCMYHNSDKYSNISKNEEYYYLVGIEEDNVGKEENEVVPTEAILVFSIKDDSLAYAEQLDSNDENTFQKKIDELEQRLPFLVEFEKEDER